LGPEDVNPATEQQRLHAANTLQQERMAELIDHLRAFRQGGPEHADWDGDAYEALIRIPGLSLGPLTQMIGPASAARLPLDDFEAAQIAMQAKLDAGRTMHLADPLTSHMARAFRGWALGEQCEGRLVHLPALIALATQRTISGRFRYCSEQKAFCPEFPLGATSEEDKAHLKILAAEPATWWLRWPLQTFVDALTRAFPSEREGASASIKTLEELLGEIFLSVNAADFAPLSKYRGAVFDACERAAPREAGNETTCVKALHDGFKGVT
ncbi:hypothetical protein B484DRAFT_410265, partial [Ochromonadaceae sp. CCMP2298]